MTESRTIKVLIVDDSVVVRGMLRELIAKHADLQVCATSSNGQQGVDDYKQRQPDVVLMDIEMPEKDGLTALKEILAYDATARVIMCSSLTQTGASATIEALRIGAVDYLAKPSSKTIHRGEDFETQLVLKIRTLSKKPAGATAESTTRTHDNVSFTLAPYPTFLPNSFPLALAIGSSTGGPKALIDLLRGLNKKISLPIFITQHIPAGFSKFLAENIQKHTGFPTHEGEQDMIVEAGHIYIAPGGKHMGIKSGAPKRIDILDTPPVNFCKPSVDVMLDSIAEHYGHGLLTVILTGMGADGKFAIQRLAAASKSNIILAQDKETSVVWGMPGAAAQTGACHGVMALSDIPKALNHLIYRKIPE